MKKLLCFLVILALYLHFGAGSVLAGSSAGLVRTFAKQNAVSEKQAQDAVVKVFKALTFELRQGNEVTVRNFGRFYLSHRQARIVRNPRTGEGVRVPDRKYPRFTSSENLRKSINNAAH